MGTPIDYDPNTPTRKLPFSDWQIQFIQNFTQLYDAFSQNHVSLDDSTVANRGNHTIVEMPQQDRDPQTSSVEYSVFSKDVEGQSDQVFLVYPGNTPVVQFTNYQIYSVPPILFGPNRTPQTTYFTFLPGKILVYFGTFGPFGSGQTGEANQLKLFPPVAKNIISVNICKNSTLPNYSPAVFINPPQDGFIKSITVQPVIPSSGNTEFYVVVANI